MLHCVTVRVAFSCFSAVEESNRSKAAWKIEHDGRCFCRDTPELYCIQQTICSVITSLYLRWLVLKRQKIFFKITFSNDIPQNQWRKLGLNNTFSVISVSTCRYCTNMKLKQIRGQKSRKWSFWGMYQTQTFIQRKQKQFSGVLDWKLLISLEDTAGLGAWKN